MIVYVMVRLGVDVGNLGAISAQSRRDLGAIWARSGRIGCASGWKFVFNDGGLGVGGMLERGFISGSRDLKSRSDCGTRERRGHSGEMGVFFQIWVVLGGLVRVVVRDGFNESS